MATDTDRRTWWGDFDIAIGEMSTWRIGPFSLGIERTLQEWRVVYESSVNPLDTTLEIQVPGEPLVTNPNTRALRFGYRRTEPLLRLLPQVADRPLVVEAETPFYLPPHEELTLYISSPLWLQIQLGNPSQSVLDVPLYRPKDTWFGPSTLEGELCYASRTKAHMQLPNLPVRHQRAISAVRIRNESDEVLPLERVNLPVPSLSLFVSAVGQLWTEAVSLRHTAGEEMAVLEVQSRPEVEPATLVSGPRIAPTRGGLIRAFSGIFK